MSQGNIKPGAGKTLAGCLLAVLLALIAPVLVMTELLSLMMVVLLPSVGVVFLYRWAGRFPALLCGALQLAVSAAYLGGTFMWMTLLMMLTPLVLLFRSESKPFFVQLRIAIVGFGAGVLALSRYCFTRSHSRFSAISTSNSSRHSGLRLETSSSSISASPAP